MDGGATTINKFLISLFILFIIPVASAGLYLRFLEFLQQKSRLILGFGSGIILSVVFMRIFPESLEISGSEFIASGMLAGVFLSVILDKLNFIREKHITHEGLACWECENPFKANVFLGLGFHYLSDGFFLGGLILTTKNFLIALLPVSIHKLIDGLILSMIFKGGKIGRSLLFISLVSLFNLLGLTFALFGIEFEHIAKFFAPVAAGILIYVAIHDFIPVLNSLSDFISFTLGIISALILVQITHTH